MVAPNASAAAGQFDAHKELGHYIGPTLLQFFHGCWPSNQQKLVTAFAIAAVSVVVTCGLTWNTLLSLSQAPISVRRSYYKQIVIFPAVFVINSAVVITCPTAWCLASGIEKIVESYTLYTFGCLLLLLMVHESAAAEVGREEKEMETQMQAITLALAKQGPRLHYGVPPLGCCFRLCMRPGHITIEGLLCAYRMLAQYSIVLALMATATVWSIAALNGPMFMKLFMVLKKLQVASSLVCLYGLFILYHVSHELLRHWNTTRKFVAIKVGLILLVVQDLLLEKFLVDFLKHQVSSCFQDLGFIYESAEIEAKWWGQVCIAAEAIPMALLLRRAFPVDEIKENMQEFHHEMLHVAMKQHSRGTLCIAIDEDGSDTDGD